MHFLAIWGEVVARENVKPEEEREAVMKDWHGWFWEVRNRHFVCMFNNEGFTTSFFVFKWTNDINLDREPGETPVNVSLADLRVVSTVELAQHGPGSETPWLVIDELIIDVTEWQQRHPGGKV